MLLRAMVTATVMVMAPLANAALYRWVDERGVVQFSDQPPPRHATGGTVSLDVPQPASGTTPLTTSIQQRSRSLSSSGSRNVRKKPRSTRRSTSSKRSNSTSSRRSTRRASPTVRASSY